MGLLLELLVDEVLNCLSGNSKFLTLGLLDLATFDLFLSSGWERSVGLPDGEDELHTAVIASKLEGHLHIVIILNDNPVVTIVVSELDFIGADLVLGSELVGRGDESLVVGCLYTFVDRALALSCEVEGDFDVQALVCCFNHSVGFDFLVNLF